ncbi:ABC transporter permease [Microbaculum marinum]|uniref:FtsX-like permease family protein n=1 Tax=Microbaculum marinum TaxID=1764581 RepID=A0AAW9RFE9_9HYPH
MRALDRKLLRDLWRLKAQVIAIALVMAAGVATLVLAVGAYRSLHETRETYYERYRFADVFAQATRAPERIAGEIAEIPGVAAVETRIVKTAILDIEGMSAPATSMLVSMPEIGEQLLNRLYLRQGRAPDPAHPDEVVVNEAFARAHGFGPGDTFEAILEGRKRRLSIVGVALSPEFIYALGPWDLMPDDERFAVGWMSRKAMEAAFDLDGAFSQVSVKLLRGASEAEVIARIDSLLERYGGRGAYGRKDQQSHAFLDAELKQLQAMARILPPIFLFVSAFLINMILSRLVALEREQIGLMKALGYRSMAIGSHYLKFVAAIAAIGVVIGGIAGTWLGFGLTRLYGSFYHFPFLVFLWGADIYATAVFVTVGAAMLGAARAVWSVVRLPPAVAMHAPAPTRYRRLFCSGRTRMVSQTTVMIGRHLIRRPVRAALTVFGISLSAAVLLASLFSFDSVEVMIDFTYFQSDRQDATVSFIQERPVSVVNDVRRLPGVLAAEPTRAVAVKVRHGHVERRVAIVGKPRGTDLSRVIDVDFQPVTLPESGFAPSEALAEILGVGVGDIVRIETLEGRKRVVDMPVTAIIQGYLGLMSYMDIDALNQLMLEGPMVTGVHLSIDEGRADDLFAAVKDMPMVGSIALQKMSLETFRRTLAENISVMISVYTGLAMVIAFGVVYNSARIQLSERGRELASLRVLGFTRNEVAWILLGELAILMLASLPLGWGLGYAIAWVTVAGLQSELYRVPLVISRQTYAMSSLVVIGAALASALIVKRRIDRLDLIDVLKTRE